ncbi:MAG: amidohydrolase family protein [Bryobacteraceae bacterium]
MTSRRQFLATAAAAAEAGRIDVQSHLYVPELLDFMAARGASPRSYRKGADRFVVVNKWVRRVLPKHTDPAAKLADMDAAGIRTTALSINDPGPELFGADGVKVARMAHDYLAALARAHPGRFFGLATLPLQDMGASLTELERCVDRLGFRGILLYSNLDGQWPDEPQFRPLFRRAEQMGIPILLHPAYPMIYEATTGYDLWGSIGLMTDTSIALSRIILAGILDEFPKLKLLCPHCGGVVPYLIGRIDHQAMVLKRGAGRIKRPPSEYLRQVWFDAVSPLPQAIRYAYDFIGPDRLLYGSDHPWVDPKLIAECVTSLRLPAADERKIFWANARSLFRL